MLRCTSPRAMRRKSVRLTVTGSLGRMNCSVSRRPASRHGSPIAWSTISRSSTRLGDDQFGERTLTARHAARGTWPGSGCRTSGSHRSTAGARRRLRARRPPRPARSRSRSASPSATPAASATRRARRSPARPAEVAAGLVGARRGRCRPRDRVLRADHARDACGVRRGGQGSTRGG